MSASPESTGVLALREARRVVEEQARALAATPAEAVDLSHARGRVLAEDLVADRDFPPFPRATRDGYAVRAADLSQVPGALRVVGEVRAGSPIGTLRISSGQAAEIMTGAPVPEDADAVVMVEYTRCEGDRVEIQRSVTAGENIVPAASEARAGQVLVPAGVRMDYATIAVAAATGKSRVRVHRRPQVAVISTGDEIVDIAATPAPHQIRNSNAHSLAAQVQAAGGEPVILPIAADDKHVLRQVIAEGLALDLLLLTGGVSMGKYDLVEQVLAEFRAQFFFTGALIQPGRPVVFGRAPKPSGSGYAPFFGLPGNPVSTMVTFEIFARPVMNALAGGDVGTLRFLRARLKSEVRAKTGLMRFLPAVLSGEYEDAEVELVLWQGSGDLASAARANCYLIVAPDRPMMAPGELVPVLPRGS